MVAQFFKGYASLEVTRPREVATDLTFLTDYVIKHFIQVIFENLVKGLFLKLFCKHLGGVAKKKRKGNTVKTTSAAPAKKQRKTVAKKDKKPVQKNSIFKLFDWGVYIFLNCYNLMKFETLNTCCVSFDFEFQNFRGKKVCVLTFGQIVCLLYNLFTIVVEFLSGYRFFKYNHILNQSVLFLRQN
jgi:hypothetical protein